MKLHRKKRFITECLRMHLILQTILLLFWVPAHLYGAGRTYADTLSVEYLVARADSLFDTHPSLTERYAEQALATAVAKGDEPGQFGAYYQLVRASFRLGKTEEAIERARIAEAGFIRLNDRYSLASLYHTWANGLFIAGEFDESQKYSDQAMALAKETGNFFALGLQYYTRAQKADSNGDVYLAIDYLDKALELEGTGRKIERIKTRANGLMGGIYGEMNDYKKALEYKLKAAAKFIEFGMYKEAGGDYASAGHFYTILSRYDSAYVCFRKALELFDRTGPEYSKYASTPAWHEMARYFDALKQPDSAFYYINKAIEQGERYDQQKSVVHYYNTATRLYYRAGKYDEALRFAKKTMELSREQHIPAYIRNSEIWQAHVYYQTGRPDSAALYYRLYLAGDTLNALVKTRRDILKLSELRVQEQTAFQREQEATKRRILTLSLAASIAVIAMLVFLLRKIRKQSDKIISINAELTEHKEELKQLLDLKSSMLDDKEREYASLCDNMVESAVFRAVFDDRTNVDTGRMDFISSGWEEMSGKTWEPCGFMDCLTDTDIFPEDRKMLRDATEYVLRGESPLLNITFRYAKGDGYIWLRTKAAAVATASGALHIDGILVDVTDRIQYEEKLIAAKEKAEESDKLKMAFFNNISHEIRTPLNAILGFAQLFDNPDNTPEQRAMMADAVKTGAAELTRMVEDIVTLSEIDSDILAVVPQPINIPELLDRIVEESQTKAKVAGKDRLEIMADNRLPDDMTTAAFDGRKISRILAHLMDNAIKHTDRGYILLSCEAMPDENMLLFSVEDTGSGIEERYREKVFVRFWKHKDHTREFRGLGIGLSLCRELLRLMHGSIRVKSEPSHGSTFSFKIKYQ
jgi:signal transduction histidine kinase/cell division protein FtsB